MPLFAPNKTRAVQTFVLKLVNNNCPELQNLADGPRLETRVNLTIAVMLAPMEKHTPLIDEAVGAVTKEFSTSGMGVVIGKPCSFDRAIVAVRIDADMHYARAKVKHVSPMGAGFYHLGLQLTEMVTPGDYTGLDELRY